MKVYILFILKSYFKNLIFVTLMMLSLSIIINMLTEFEFFNEINVPTFYPIYLSFLNSPDLIFEMFPFIFLISTQLFFINLYSNNQIEIFKYSGLRNSSIIKILCFFSFILGVLIIFCFYFLSSNFKNLYLESKLKYTTDGKYLAVITNNGLWIKDKILNDTYIISASKIDDNYLIDTLISQFDENFNIVRNIKSKKINIKNFEWQIYNPEIFENEEKIKLNLLKKKFNYNYERIKNLFSNLSSLSIDELFDLKQNYTELNYSTTEVEVQINKLISYPFYLTMITLLSSIIMFKVKNYTNVTLKIIIGLFLSVIIYYTFNFFNVMGSTEKLSVIAAVWTPIIFLTFANLIMVYGINEK
ncbi:LptF/LptG family permease [Candidatus Pelagibacter sp. HIMB1611]|uniref:LptF/LptG family permease n=1 Tax=unclassified Candidatus Pelagibacter TaxID=2647897 RepID=UPI003F87FEE2